MRVADQVARAVRAAADKKAQDVVVLDVHELLAITDFFIICSGSSDRQVRTISEEITKQLRAAGLTPAFREGEEEGTWVLIDYREFVVHIFSEEGRTFYDLERLWKDAPRVPMPELEDALG